MSAKLSIIKTYEVENRVLIVPRLLDDLDKAVEGESEYKPFFCHQGMPTVEGKYSPEREADGTPIGFPICAGWLNEVMFQVNDERRSSLGKRFSSIFRVYDRVRKAEK